MSRWRAGWKMTTFVIVMLPLVLALGFWQLDRAREMRGYQDQYFARMAMTPEPPGNHRDMLPFERLRLEGWYDAHMHFLVDNQVRQGRQGYWVVSRFTTVDGAAWLVNRGWIAAPGTRDSLPEIPTPPDRVVVVGVFWPETGLVPLLAAEAVSGDWPRRVQRLDVARMAGPAGVEVHSEIRLEAGHPGVFAAAPLDAVFSPDRHRGYAVQWFGLAIALGVGFVLFGFRKND